MFLPFSICIRIRTDDNDDDDYGRDQVSLWEDQCRNGVNAPDQNHRNRQIYRGKAMGIIQTQENFSYLTANVRKHFLSIDSRSYCGYRRYHLQPSPAIETNFRISW